MLAARRKKKLSELAVASRLPERFWLSRDCFLNKRVELVLPSLLEVVEASIEKLETKTAVPSCHCRSG